MICRVRSGWCVLGDVQFLPRYSLLLPDPVLPSLNHLSRNARIQFLSDMTASGDALLEITNAVRINYEILANTEPALHAHLFLRHAGEPEHLRRMSAWFYDRTPAPPFEESRDRPPDGKSRRGSPAYRHGDVTSRLACEYSSPSVYSAFR